MRFDSTQVPRHMRLRKFEEFVRGGRMQLLNRVSFRPLDSQNPNVNIDEHLFGQGAYLSFLRSSGLVVSLDAGGPDARNNAVTASILKKGDAEVRTRTGQFKIGAGDIYLNATAEYQTTFSDNEVVRMVFPSGSMKEVFRRSGEFVVIRDHEPASQLLKAAIYGMEDALRGNEPASIKLLSRIAVGLASAVIEDNIFRSAGSGYEIVRERAREYIHDNIGRPDLSVVEIAAYAGTSRATLYRVFESLGGVREYISFVRLELAKSMMGGGSPDRGAIANIAYACGFSSPSQFGKSFKNRFGISPTQFAGIGETDEVSRIWRGGANLNSHRVSGSR